MQQGKIDAGMTTEPTISRLIASGVGKLLVDLRTPTTTQAAFGGPYPFVCIFLKNDYVNSHKVTVQKLVNAYVKTLKWIHTHTAEQIADMMPADYYAGNKALYVRAYKASWQCTAPMVSCLQMPLSLYSPQSSRPISQCKASRLI
jgi:NitT/TauT family transport system substrate-binding protein